MKGLLQSKKFRDNLKKWLFMYVGTLCLLTSVITYSKYMSQVNGSDSATVAKFNVVIEADNNLCSSLVSGSNTSSCNLSSSRPLKSYDFYFTVDTSELDVKTRLVITLKNSSGFSFSENSLVELNTSGQVIKNIALSNSYNKNNELIGKKYVEDIDLNSSVSKRYYKITMNFDNSNPDNFLVENSFVGLIIDYSATQID